MSNPSRKGDCIRTFTGIKFWPMDPRPEEIVIEDIAHALSMQCRFGGHCHEFYSVAQHSLRVSHAVESSVRRLGNAACLLADLPHPDPLPKEREWKRIALAGLLHDASEAYLVDVPRPVKVHLTNYKDIEENLMRVIAGNCGFQYPLHAQVHFEDENQLIVEMRDLFPRDARREMRSPSRQIKPIHPLNQNAAKVRFLERFRELTEKES